MKWTPEHTANAASFHRALKKQGFDFFTGVPCSLLGALIDELSRQKKRCYYPAVREDAAMGMAAGANLAGRLPAVLMQNSGLGYSLNVLTSLNLIYKIPILCLVTGRGFYPDAPEHLVMGKACVNLLKDIGVRSFVPGAEELETALDKAKKLMMKTREPVVIFIQRGIFGS